MIWAYAALAGYQMWSSFQQAETVQAQAELTSNISEMNARYAEIDAWEAEKYGYTQTARYQTVVDQTVADQRAAFASQGVDVSFGTAKEIQQEAKLTGFLNQLDIQRQARAKAMGLKFEASNYRLNSGMQMLQGQAQAGATRAAGIAAGLSTAVSGYGAYLRDMKELAAAQSAKKSPSSTPSTYGVNGSNTMVPMDQPYRPNLYPLGDWDFGRNKG